LQARQRVVLLPGWWFELLTVLCAAVVLAIVLHAGSRLPSLLPLLVFAIVLLVAENAMIILPSATGVSPSFMVVMAAIGAFGVHGTVLGACVLGSGGGFTLSILRKGRYTAALFNCAQYLLAAAAASASYVLLGHVGTWAAFAGAVVAFATVNIVLVLPQAALNLRQPPRRVWVDMRPALPNYFAFGLLGILVGQIYNSLGPVAVPLLVIPAIIARKAFASFVELREAHEATMRVFVRAIEAKDPYTAGHTERVAKYALYVGEELGLSPARLEHLRYAALMHDVGKLAVPKKILNKPGRLTADEYTVVQRHNQVCIDILTKVDFMRSMVGTASDRFAHYDRDRQREQDQLVLEAHIVAVADAFDAMTTTRPYRKALPIAEARRRLSEGAGTQWDARIVTAFLRLLEATPLGQPEPLPLPVHAAAEKAA